MSSFIISVLDSRMNFFSYFFNQTHVYMLDMNRHLLSLIKDGKIN